MIATIKKTKVVGVGTNVVAEEAVTTIHKPLEEQVHDQVLFLWKIRALCSRTLQQESDEEANLTFLHEQGLALMLDEKTSNLFVLY